jgi:hypothetical protein
MYYLPWLKIHSLTNYENHAQIAKEEEAKKRSKEKEEVLDSDNIASKNTKNQIF